MEIIELNNQYANYELEYTLPNAQNTVNILCQTTPENILLITFSMNNNRLTGPIIATPNQFLIQQNYIINQIGGNFIFQCENNEYPNYLNFNDTCILYFVPVDELEELQNVENTHFIL